MIALPIVRLYKSMIRRELKLDKSAAIWLMVSQVEHAHVSGEIMRHWREPLSTEVVEAIAHHDDGWATWEVSPKLNSQVGGPYSFLEMPLEESLIIWDNSIASARRIGSLAGWMVSGHFYNLLAGSEHARDPPAVAWLTAKRKVRTSWLDEWIRADKSHSLEYAKRAQELLLMADLFSLWLCCDCPIGNGESSILSQSTMKLRADTLLAQFQFKSPECMLRESISKKRVEGISWIVPTEPFPCDTSPVRLRAQATAVPVAAYQTWHEIAEASWPVELDWRLTPAV
jgi:hypothetical protein